MTSSDSSKTPPPIDNPPIWLQSFVADTSTPLEASIEPPQDNTDCAGCGSGLIFNPDLGKLWCAYCDRTVDIIPTDTFVKEQYFDDSQRRDRLSTDAVEVKCSGCSAQITFEPPQVVGTCPFCATPISAQPDSAKPTLTPNGIIPFSINRKDAQLRLTQWLSRRRFAPAQLAQLAQPEKLVGIYLPFWTFDWHPVVKYTGQRGHQDSEQVIWEKVSGSFQLDFNDVLIPAITSINPGQVKTLSPWPLEKQVPYSSSFLRGFHAQRYEISSEDGFDKLKQQIWPQLKPKICRDIGGKKQRVTSFDVSYNHRSFRHLLIPFWIMTYRYGNQTYQVWINGRNGVIAGDYPRNIKKVAWATAMSLLFIAGILSLSFKGSRTWIFRQLEQTLPRRSSPTAVVSSSAQGES